MAGDSGEIRNNLLARARAGEVQSAFELGKEMCRSGDSREKDRSFVWMTIAAEGGLLDAQYMLGRMYQQRADDKEKAPLVDLSDESLDSGDAVAGAESGKNSESGVGLESAESRGKAVLEEIRTRRKAAREAKRKTGSRVVDHVPAGSLDIDGSVSARKAVEWLTVAAEAGYELMHLICCFFKKM